MRNEIRICGVTMAFLLSTAFVYQTWAAPPKPVSIKPGIRALLKIERDYIATIGDDDSVLKKGAKVDIYLQSGKRFDGVEITELQLGKQKNSIKVLGCTASKGGKQKIQASTLLHIAAEDGGFDIVQDSTTKAFVALDLVQRDEQAKKRLAASGHSLWEDPTADVNKEAIQSARALFAQAKELFPDHEFQLQETEFFLFFTDMPTDQIAGYVTNLDTMYRQMCVAFGVLPGKNIWQGKCAVIAFLDREAFHRFEIAVMKNPKPQGAQGLHHGMGDGRVVITIFRGNDAAFFATVLVHETAHGFLHRLRSNVHIASWLNEGIADWIAGVAVPASGEVSRRQSDGIAQMRNRGTMGGFFDPEKKFNSTDYGIASNLTQFMLQTDPNLYRAFLMAIKDGYSTEESLKLTYECSLLDLIQSYGNSIGVHNLQP